MPQTSLLFLPYIPFHRLRTLLLCSHPLLDIFFLPYTSNIPFPILSIFAGVTSSLFSLLDPSMTSVSINPPSPFLLADQTQDQNQLFVSPNNQDSTNSISSCHSFFNVRDPTQAGETGELRHDQEEDGLVFYGGSSSHQFCNLSFSSPQTQQVMDDRRNVCDYKEEEEEERKSGYGSAKWMSSKMRLMRKMMIPNTSPVPHKVSNISPTIRTQEHQKTQTQRAPPNHRNNTTTRVCAECNTTSTPLWRGGPKGPKSLCNACGIRQRKARRAVAEAGNGVASFRVMNSKEKRARTNHFVALKNKCKASASSSVAGTSQGERKNIGFKDFAFSWRNNVSVVEQVFPQDEVAQAALLLMDLSCAPVPT